MDMKRHLLLGAAVLLWPCLAQAQEKAASVRKDATAVLVDEILVTATKKGYGESVQDVPLAVTALGQAQLEAKFVQNLQGLSYTVPNVQLEAVGTTPGYANFSIRGLGINSSIPSIDPTVGVFVDGVYLGVNAGVVFDNFDIEGLEVLRGPQGLLFGRNVTGGAVVLRTTRPSFDFKASAKASVETGLKKTVSGLVSGPLVPEILAGKIAILYSDDDGWFRNRFDGSKFGEAKEFIIRPALSLKGENYRVDLRYEHGQTKGDGPPGQSHALFARDSFDISLDFRGFYDNKWDQATIETNVDIGFGDGVVTNIAGYRAYKSTNAVDTDATPAPLFNGFSVIDQSQFSDELRYAGKFGKVDVTTGLYYFTQDLFYGERRNLLGNRLIVSGGGSQDQTTWGAFTSVDWHLSPTLTLNLGGRYSHEHKAVEVSTLRANGCDIEAERCAINFTDSKNWKGFTPKVGFQWKPSDEAQVYGLYTRGFRSGGYNLRNTDPGVPPGPFDQETQDSFELGLKHEFGPRGRINISSFYNRVKDLQREIALPGPLGASQVIRNTADATIKGIEAEAQVRLRSNLVLTAQFGYVDGQYRNVAYDLTGDGIINAADRALALPRLSPWTYGAGVIYDHSLGGLGTATARVSYDHRDKSYFTDNNQGFLQGANMLDASLTLTTQDRKLRLSIYGRNLLDEVTIGGDTILPATFGGAGASFSPLNKGRVIGAEVAVDF
jgi:iron complex outermembrane receptor protein